MSKQVRTLTEEELSSLYNHPPVKEAQQRFLNTMVAAKTPEQKEAALLLQADYLEQFEKRLAFLKSQPVPAPEKKVEATFTGFSRRP